MGFIRNIEPIKGWSLKCHPAFFRHVREHQLSDPVQVCEFDQFVTRCHSGMSLVDCGAHYGLFSLAAAHFGGTGATVLAIDPSPMACDMVAKVARLNKLESQIRILESSVGSIVGHMRMISAGVNSAGYYVGMTTENEESQFSRVYCVTVDEICSSRNITATHLKIDVEGMEEAVIEGAHRTLSSRSAPIVFLELHCNLIRMAGGDPAQSLRLLSSHGYGFRDVKGLPIGVDEALALPLVRLLAEKANQ